MCLSCSPDDETPEDLEGAESPPPVVSPFVTDRWETPDVTAPPPPPPPEDPRFDDLTQTFEDHRTGYKLRFKWEGLHGPVGYEYLLQDTDQCMVFSKYQVDRPINTTDRFNVRVSRIQTSRDIVTEMLPYKVRTALGNGLSLTVADDSTYEAGESITVDGCEATRFTGTVRYTDGEETRREGAIVGYGILGAVRPMLIFVLDYSEDRRHIEALTDLIDRVVLTFEDEAAGA
jgi:hypothetical protein